MVDQVDSLHRSIQTAPHTLTNWKEAGPFAPTSAPAGPNKSLTSWSRASRGPNLSLADSASSSYLHLDCSECSLDESCLTDFQADQGYLDVRPMSVPSFDLDTSVLVNVSLLED